MARKLPALVAGRKLVGKFWRMELANCRYCGEVGFWGKAHATCVAIAGQGRREMRAAFQAAFVEDYSMAAIGRIVNDISQRSCIPEAETRALLASGDALAAQGTLARVLEVQAPLETKNEDMTQVVRTLLERTREQLAATLIIAAASEGVASSASVHAIPGTRG